MDIIIPDKWLRDFLDTKAKPDQIAKYLSLGGPSVDKLRKIDNSYIYEIEITTNRVDIASVYGIAREAAAILPRFGIKAKRKQLKKDNNYKFKNKVRYLDVKVDSKLCPRFTAVLIKDVKIKKSPDWIKERLNLVGERPINNIVDISNFIMHEIGQPVHTFDYDKITDATMKLRESKKGEKIITLDGKKHTLPGGDIVIEDGKGRLIDLAGIMGAENSSVDKNTKNVLLFVQNYNPTKIRKTSMTLPKRTQAAVLFEKGLDPEKVTLGIKRGIELFVKLTNGTVEKDILDLYPKPYKRKSVKINLELINKRLGIKLNKKEVQSYLKPLGFKTTWSGKNANVAIPSFRSDDIKITEDVIEEVARIYGYQNLPSNLMEGKLPKKTQDTQFEFEHQLKNYLAGWGGIETYTLSLVPKEALKGNGLKLKNPLGEETGYLRNNMQYSLNQVVENNKGYKDRYHFFEMANIYLPKRAKLPEEKLILSGIFSKYSYREAKGIIEALFEKLNIKVKYIPEDNDGFSASRVVKIQHKSQSLGLFGILNKTNCIYYELYVDKLRKYHKPYKSFIKKSKYPPQIEDITLVLPTKTKVQDLITFIKNSDDKITKINLKDIYKDAYTFRIWYQSSEKTLSDEEVKTIRNKILKGTKNKFGTVQKN